MVIKKFRGDNYFLSNFFPAKVIYESRTYPTSEHAYQAMKTWKESMKEVISKLDTPGEAKSIGRRLEVRSDWKAVKIKIMEEIVMAKFVQNPDLKKMLIATGDEELVEGNDWHDDFWGVDMATGKGENHLGKVLMKTREQLKNA